MSEYKDTVSVEDAFDQLMADGGHSANEPATNSQDVDTKDTDTDVDASTDTTKTETPSGFSDVLNSTASDSANGDPNADMDWKSEASKWEQKFRSFEGRMQAELARRRDEEDRRQQQYMEVLAKVNPVQTGGQQSEIDKLNKFKQLREDFPEIAEAVEEYIKNEVVEARVLVDKEISSRMEPVISNLSQTQMYSHIDRIKAKHPDALEIRQSPTFNAWLASLPSFAQAGAVHVIKLGTAEEVVALLDQYKSSINKNTTQNTVKPTEKENNTSAVSPEMVAAIRSGLAVKPGKSGDPSTVSKSVNNDDFDAGWEDAVKQFGIK